MKKLFYIRYCRYYIIPIILFCNIQNCFAQPCLNWRCAPEATDNNPQTLDGYCISENFYFHQPCNPNLHFCECGGAPHDPNDKSVNPPNNSISKRDTWLFYKIDFQNTGTAPAINVIIKDTLDLLLDKNTFTIVNSSHPFTYNIDNNRRLTFSFLNIMLPDSNVNEPGSHGYITYSIKAKSDIPNNTIITNKAFIQFDSEPDVATGTTANILSDVVTLNLKTFIQGFYRGNGNMIAVVDPTNYPTLCDTITVELHNSISPYGLVQSKTDTIDVFGNGQFAFSSDVFLKSYYIVIRHRNILETWSKDPVLFSGISVSLDLTKTNSVKICDQEWMNRNLDVDHYRNGDPIPEVSDSTQWSNLTTGAYCYNMYNLGNDSVIYCKLYNWYAINDPRGLAPNGWHIPNNNEWSTLVNCLGGIESAGGKLKEAGTMHWYSPNTGATNSTGFTAQPAGPRNFNGLFYENRIHCDFWSSTELDFNFAYYRYLDYSYSNIGISVDRKNCGFSVRCIKD